MKKGKRQRDDFRGGGTRPRTHASSDIDAAPHLYDGAYEYIHATQAYAAKRTARYYAQSVERRLGSDDTPRRYAIAITHTDVSHGYATRFYGGLRREVDTRGGTDFASGVAIGVDGDRVARPESSSSS